MYQNTKLKRNKTGDWGKTAANHLNLQVLDEISAISNDSLSLCYHRFIRRFLVFRFLRIYAMTSREGLQERSSRDVTLIHE